MRHPISVQPQSTYQSSNHQLWIFIIFIRHHVGAYHGPYLIFHPMTVTCDIMCTSFEVMCSCRVVVLWGFLGRARDKRNTLVRGFVSPPSVHKWGTWGGARKVRPPLPPLATAPAHANRTARGCPPLPLAPRPTYGVRTAQPPTPASIHSRTECRGSSHTAAGPPPSACPPRKQGVHTGGT